LYEIEFLSGEEIPMSYQTGTDYDNKVGEVVQRLIDSDGEYEELLVSKDLNGGWNVTADKKKFWSWLLTLFATQKVMVTMVAN
jgi:hypothetical protein